MKPDALEPLIIDPVASAWDVLLPTRCKPEPWGLGETASAFLRLVLPGTETSHRTAHACPSHSTQRGCVLFQERMWGATVPRDIRLDIGRRLGKSCGEGSALMG